MDGAWRTWWRMQAVRKGAELPALRWLVERGAPVGSREQVQ